MPVDRTDIREGSAQGSFRRGAALLIDFLLQPVDGRGIEEAITQQTHLQFGQRIARPSASLRFRTVGPSSSEKECE